MLIKIFDSLRLCQGIIKGQFFCRKTERFTFFISSGNIISKFQEFLNYFFIGKHTVEVLIHSSLNDFRKFFRSDNICSSIYRNLLSNQFFQYFYSQIFFFHTGYFFKKFWIKKRKSFLYIRKKIDDSIAFDTLFQQLINTGIYFIKG